jgi:dimeric dUTPase (all-alpha-NTP-PPase superfamily)
MNLEKLFAAQKVLRDRINYNEPDRFNKLILALLVELGECANEWRGFKFWSVNQLPHTSAVRTPCMMEEDKEYYNPLLEEYVDVLHFVLEVGLEMGINNFKYAVFTSDTIEKQFLFILQEITTVSIAWSRHNYRNLLQLYLGLGQMLGFSPEQIEQGYLEKNKINHVRQETGY